MRTGTHIHVQVLPSCNVSEVRKNHASARVFRCVRISMGHTAANMFVQRLRVRARRRDFPHNSMYIFAHMAAYVCVCVYVCMNTPGQAADREHLFAIISP